MQSTQTPISSPKGAPLATADPKFQAWKLPNSVQEQEIEWMLAHRPLEVTIDDLVRDYGREAAEEMVALFTQFDILHLLGVLNWPGVGTRFRQFVSWLQTQPIQHNKEVAIRDVFVAFAKHLGRVNTFRALALRRSDVDNIFSCNEIMSTGGLRVNEKAINNSVAVHGVRKIAVCRLYISNMQAQVGPDPSLSLHDHWETTTCIASGYADKTKLVHLFQLSVPVIESLGWTLHDVALQSGHVLGDHYRTRANQSPWFMFGCPAANQGVWFDGREQTTERYTLYTVPFLRERLVSFSVFNSLQEIRDAVSPFVASQLSAAIRDGACGNQTETLDGLAVGVRCGGEVLRVESQKIDELSKIAKLAPAIENAPALQRVMFQKCTFNSECIGVLAAAMAKSAKLRSVSLSACELNDELVSTFCDQFQRSEPCAIQILAFDNNAIQNQGAHAVAQLLSCLPALQTLSVSANNIQEEGAAKILEATKAHNGLKKVHFANNPVSAGTTFAFSTLNQNKNKMGTSRLEAQ